MSFRLCMTFCAVNASSPGETRSAWDRTEDLAGCEPDNGSSARRTEGSEINWTPSDKRRFSPT